MKILIYGYEYPPLGGGVANALKNLFMEFEKYEDLQIDFVTVSVDGKAKVHKPFRNITFYELNLGDKRNRLNAQKISDVIKYTWKTYWLTWKLIFKNKYDASMAFGFPGALVPMLFRWRMKYFVSLRGVDVPGYKKEFRVFYLLYKPLSFFMWAFASKVITNSEALKKDAQKTNRFKEIAVIPNGIDLDKIKPTREEDKFNKFTITSGGTHLRPVKGINYLIEGFAKFLVKTKSDSTLLLIGDGSDKENLMKLAKELNVSENVNFVGTKSHEWIEENLPKCHVFCLASLNEGMSNAALEALASGLPILMTNVGGNAELLKEGENGFTINKSDSDDICSRLVQLHEDSKLRKSMGEASASWAKEMSWSNSAKEYYKIFTNAR
jgi:glycosyltransferase involved in cell wall biosynthesis